MAEFVYDGAYSPNLAECKGKGAIAMAHYLTRGYASTSAQPAAVMAEGMGVILNWEGTASELKGATRAQGRQCAHEALDAVPVDVPRDGTVAIYYSVDTDLTDLSVCDEAFRGINEVHAGSGLQVRMYGEGGLIVRLHKLGLVQGKQWLSMSEGFGAFRDTLTSGLVSMVQMHDAVGNWIGTDVRSTDRNTVLDPYGLGAWWPRGHKYAHRPAPTPKGFTVDADAKARFDQLDAEVADLKQYLHDIFSLKGVDGQLHQYGAETLAEVADRKVAAEQGKS